MAYALPRTDVMRIPAKELSVVALLALSAGCSRDVLDALRPRDASPPPVDLAGDTVNTVDAVDARDAVDRDPCLTGPTDAACGPATWPNDISFTNSDAWLRQNHDRLVSMRPRVLVLDFFNGDTIANIRTLAMNQASALAESSRYHAYSDPAAPVFMTYEILTKVVDLLDRPAPPAGWTFDSSTLLPVDANGAFDPEPLFNQTYADRYAFPDPTQPSHNLTLCELFERGMINEVWLAVGDEPPRGPLIMERKQKYDSTGAPLAGQFEPCAGGGACLTDIPCDVTVRMAHLSPVRGLTCDVEIRSFPFESKATLLAVPYLGANATEFFNLDLRKFGVSFDSWYDICGAAMTPCITYPTPTSATGVDVAGTPWTINPFIQGCGSARFPPNARFRNNFTNAASVQSRCENFGMKNGSGGADTPDTYSLEKVSAYSTRFGSDCGGGWHIYMRQSFPGLGNKAIAADGKPMKNWWPFQYY